MEHIRNVWSSFDEDAPLISEENVSHYFKIQPDQQNIDCIWSESPKISNLI